MARPLKPLRICLCLLLCVLCLLPVTQPVLAAEAETEESTAAGMTVAPVYYRANPNSTRIGWLVDGTPLTVLDTTGNYYKIDCYDMNGYISQKLVAQVGEEYYVNCSEEAGASVLPTQSVMQTLPLRGQIAEVAKQQLGIRYVWGGTTRRGFDCSGFTQYVYKKCGLTLTRSCISQIGEGTIIPKEDLQCGDLVFFKRTTNSKNFVTHVGIYLGDGKLIHASSSKGITIVELESDYYVKHYLCARRILQTSAPELETPVTAASALATGLTAKAARPNRWVLTLEPDMN